MPRRKSGCFQPLEKKLYTRQEMAALTGIPLENKNFKRSVETWLTTYGYTYELTSPRGGDFRITGTPQTAEQRLHTLMIDEMGLDRQTQPREFAYYIYFLMTYPNAEIMPLVEQNELISKLYGRSFGNSTIYTWQRKLQEAGVVDVRPERHYWKTKAVMETVNGQEVPTDRRIRVFIEDPQNDPEYKTYWQMLTSILERNIKETGNPRWGDAYAEIWNAAGIHITRCPARLINIIGDHAQEVCSLAEAVVEADMEKNGLILPSKVDEETGEILA